MASPCLADQTGARCLAGTATSGGLSGCTSSSARPRGRPALNVFCRPAWSSRRGQKGAE